MQKCAHLRTLDNSVCAAVEHAPNDPKAFPHIAQTGLTVFWIFATINEHICVSKCMEKHKDNCVAGQPATIQAGRSFLAGGYAKCTFTRLQRIA